MRNDGEINDTSSASSSASSTSKTPAWRSEADARYFLRHGESLSNAAPDTLALPEAEGDQLSARGEVQARGGGRADRRAGHRADRLQPARAGPADGRGGRQVRGSASKPEIWDWIHELREPSDYASLTEAGAGAARWSNRMADNAATRSSPAGDGESFADLLRRVERTRERLVADDVDHTLLVGHGIFCRFMFALTLFGDEFCPAPRRLAVADRLAELRPLDVRPRRRRRLRRPRRHQRLAVRDVDGADGRPGAGHRDRRSRSRCLADRLRDRLLRQAGGLEASFVLAYICIRSCCPSRIVQTWAKCISTETPLAFERPCWRTMTTTLSPAST